MQSTTLRLLAGLPAGLFLFACAATDDSTRTVDELIRTARYDEAVRVAAARHGARPDDPEAEAAHRRATAAHYMKLGRVATFDDRDETALDYFLRAQELWPVQDAAGLEVIDEWVRKTQLKLAERWMDAAHEADNSADMIGARDAYETALSYAPGLPRAVEGLARTLIKINYREGLGEDYYKAGIRDLREYALHPSRAHFHYSGKYLPESERAARRATEVEALLAEERLAVARKLEKDGVYGGARNEYRIALLLDPENAEAQEGLERNTIEMEVFELIGEADMFLRRGRLEQALEKLAEAGTRTERQQELVEQMQEQAQTARLQLMYDDAISLEQDFLYEESVAAYTRLLDDAGFFKDAITRRDTLMEFIRRAETLYEKAANAGDPTLANSYLRQIDIFWPEYRDVSERLSGAQ